MFVVSEQADVMSRGYTHTHTNTRNIYLQFTTSDAELTTLLNPGTLATQFNRFPSSLAVTRMSSDVNTDVIRVVLKPTGPDIADMTS